MFVCETLASLVISIDLDGGGLPGHEKKEITEFRKVDGVRMRRRGEKGHKVDDSGWLKVDTYTIDTVVNLRFIVWVYRLWV